MTNFKELFHKRKSKRVFLLLNGEPPKKEKLPYLTNYGYFCATDGAFDTMLNLGINPDLVTGDFDSVTDLPEDCEIIETPDQNYTDFEKILDILHLRNLTNIDVFGASGKEQDHFLGNLNTALLWKYKLNITFHDNYGTYYILAARNILIQFVKDKTISLFPFPKVTKITTEGLQYELQEEDLELGNKIGTRNKAVKDSISIKHDTGNLVVFIND